MTKRTNEQPPLALELRSPAAIRLASIFLSNHVLSLRQIYNILDNAVYKPNFTRSSLRGVLSRWQKRNILLTDGRRYILNPRGGREILLSALNPDDEAVREQKALELLSSVPDEVRTERVIVDITPRWWAEVFDLPAAWMENSRLYCRTDEHITKAMWALCEKKPSSSKDRSQKAVHRDKEGTYTLIVFPRGKFHVYTKENPRWLDILGNWFKDGGLPPSDLRLIAMAIKHKLSRAVGTCEIPLKVDVDPVQQFECHIETANRKASIRLVHSHFDLGEIEARGDLQFRLDWLAMLAGASIETLGRSEEFEQIKTERTELKDDLSRVRKTLEEVSDKMEKQEETIKAIEKEREQIETERQKKKKDPDYIG